MPTLGPTASTLLKNADFCINFKFCSEVLPLSSISSSGNRFSHFCFCRHGWPANVTSHKHVRIKCHSGTQDAPVCYFKWKKSKKFHSPSPDLSPVGFTVIDENESLLSQLNRRTKHGWQYGLSPSSLNVPLLSWHWQNEQTKCSGWYFRYMAVMQRPVTGLWHPAHSDPRCAWKCVSQYGRLSCSKKLPLPNGTRHSCRCITANRWHLSLPTILYAAQHMWRTSTNLW